MCFANVIVIEANVTLTGFGGYERCSYIISRQKSTGQERYAKIDGILEKLGIAHHQCERRLPVPVGALYGTSASPILPYDNYYRYLYFPHICSIGNHFHHKGAARVTDIENAAEGPLRLRHRCSSPARCL